MSVLTPAQIARLRNQFAVRGGIQGDWVLDGTLDITKLTPGQVATAAQGATADAALQAAQAAAALAQSAHDLADSAAGVAGTALQPGDNLSELVDNNQIEGAVKYVRYAVKTDTQTIDLASAASSEISGLSFSYSLHRSTNVVVLRAYVCVGEADYARSVLRWTVDTVAITGWQGAGAGAGYRILCGSMNGCPTGADWLMTQSCCVAAYAPGDTSAHSYAVRILNAAPGPGNRTYYVNRSATDDNTAWFCRAASCVFLEEIDPRT